MKKGQWVLGFTVIRVTNATVEFALMVIGVSKRCAQNIHAWTFSEIYKGYYVMCVNRRQESVGHFG